MVKFPAPKTAYADVCAVTTAELIESYKESIQMMRGACQAELDAHKLVEKADPNFGDDLYLLRYVLSHHKKGPDACWKALFATMTWRAKHADMLYKLRVYNQAPPNDEKLRPAAPTGPHFRTKQGHFILLVRNGLANGNVLLEKGTPDDICEWMTFSKEWIHSKCDDETRRTGRLIKIVAVMDFKHGSLLAYNGKFKDAMSRASTESELFYPQLLYRSVIFNMPSVIAALMKVIMKLMPKSLQEKMTVCTETEPAEIAAFTEKELGITAENLPSYLGGKCNTCVGGCVKGFSNTLNRALTAEDIKTVDLGTWVEYIGRCDRTNVKGTGEALENSLPVAAPATQSAVTPSNTEPTV